MPPIQTFVRLRVHYTMFLCFCQVLFDLLFLFLEILFDYTMCFQSIRELLFVSTRSPYPTVSEHPSYGHSKRFRENPHRILTFTVECDILLSSRTWEGHTCYQHIAPSVFSFQSKILRPLPITSRTAGHPAVGREPTPYGQPVECRFSKSAATSVAFLLIAPGSPGANIL